jgi:hypothetical protein
MGCKQNSKREEKTVVIPHDSIPLSHASRPKREID